MVADGERDRPLSEQIKASEYKAMAARAGRVQPCNVDCKTFPWLAARRELQLASLGRCAAVVGCARGTYALQCLAASDCQPGQNVTFWILVRVFAKAQVAAVEAWMRDEQDG